MPALAKSPAALPTSGRKRPMLDTPIPIFTSSIRHQINHKSLTISSLLWGFLPQSRAPAIWPIAGVEFAHWPVVLLDIFSKRHIVIHSKFRHSVFRKPAVGPDHITHGSQLHL